MMKPVYRIDHTDANKITIEPKFLSDGFYQHLEKYWRVHQLILAAALYLLGVTVGK